MRGGTSKGLMFLADDLPDGTASRDAVLLAAMGSPDERQIDGMGGSHPLTSKVAVVSLSPRDDVITRHRCTRPDLDVGESWECPECGSTWTAREEEETCGECGQGVGTMRKTWDSVPGDRIDTAPKYDPPPPFMPFRNLFRDITAPPAYSAWRGRAFAPAPLGECYRMASGAKVH